MRRRSWLPGAAVTAAPLAVAVAIAIASTATAQTVATPTPVAIKCHAIVTTAIPAGSTTVTPGSAGGTQYGSVTCSKLFGHGVQSDKFTLLDSGDLKGTFTDYFGAGSIHGKFALTPANTSFTPASFASESYSGKLTVGGGTGIAQLAKGKGKLTCSSDDGLHMSCTERLKLTS